MVESQRSSGIDIIEDVAWGTHLCQFYDTKEDLTDILIPYFKAGLENNELCVWITSEPLGAEEAKEALRMAFPDLGAYLEKGQIEIISYNNWYVKEGGFSFQRVLNGWIEKLNHALENGFEGMRLSENFSWLEKKDWDYFIDYAGKMDDTIGNYRMVALGSYSVDKCNATRVIEVTSSHQFSLIKREGKWERRDNFGRKKAEETAAIHVARDINEHKQEEHRIHRCNSILDGINRILGSVVKAETEEELENECLSVALELTDSQLGFVGEVGADGSLHEIAISEIGWDQCLMNDETGHYRPPGNFVLHGLYGHVVNSAKGFFTNDPQLYPCSIGVPPVHPSLMSFLGVPLIQDGKPIGVLAVANREGGYSCEQQKDLEAIVPAVIQVLQRKKAEMEQARAEEALREKESRKNFLFELGDSIRELTDTEQITAIASELLGRYMNASGVVYCEIDPTGKYSNVWSDWTDGTVPSTVGRYSMDDFGIGDLYRQGYIRRTDDVKASFKGGEVAEHCALKIRASIGIPRLKGGRLTSVIAVHSSKPRHWTDAEIELIREVGDRIFTEIERARAEKALLESEERYRAIFENSKDAIIVTDPEGEGKILSVNPAAAEMFGWTEQEMIGLARKHILDMDDPHLESVIDELGSMGLTHSTYKRRDGTVFTGELASGDFTQANGKRYAVSIIRDITKRKQDEEALKEAYGILEEKVKERTAELEEAYRSLLENERRLSEVQKMAHIGIWDWDLVTNQKYWSEEMYRIYGCNPQGLSLPYNEFLNCIHPDDRDFVDNATREALKGKAYAIDFRIVLANGEKRIVHSRGEAVFNEKNIPIRIRGAVLDITERKRAEKALAKIEIARKKEIHHRIKNNLQVISSLLDLQAEKFNKKECIKDSEVLEAFRESQDRVMSIALIHEELHEVGGEDVLNFSLYLEKLVDKLFLTYRLGDTDISLNVDLEENLFFDIDTAIPVGIIINELLSNSLKHAFIGRDKGKIQIKLRREEKGESVNIIEESKNEGCKSTDFILAVSDNGVGIPENLDTKDLDSLGLQLVTSLVDQLNGKLALKRNNGAEFTIRFAAAKKMNVDV